MLCPNLPHWSGLSLAEWREDHLKMPSKLSRHCWGFNCLAQDCLRVADLLPDAQAQQKQNRAEQSGRLTGVPSSFTAAACCLCSRQSAVSPFVAPADAYSYAGMWPSRTCCMSTSKVFKGTGCVGWMLPGVAGSRRTSACCANRV